MIWFALLTPAFPTPPISVVGQPTQHLEVQSGDHRLGGITLVNHGEEVQDVLLWQQDRLFSADGRGSNAEWVMLERREASVRPGQTVEVAWMLDVPRDVDRGRYASVVLVETVERGEIAAVEIVTRVGDARRR
jgi:hypothetical protein